MADVLQRDVDEVGGPEQRGVQGEAFRRDDRPELVEGSFNRAGDLPDVGTELRVDHHDHPLDALDRPRSDAGLRPFHHAAEVPETDHCAVLFPHYAQRQERRGQGLALGAHEDSLVGIVEHPGPPHAGGTSGGGHDVRNSEPVAAQPGGIELDLELPHFPSPNGRARDAGDRQEARLEGPVGKGALIAEAPRLRGETDHEDGAR